MEEFFTGCHHPSDARHAELDPVMISRHALRSRKTLKVGRWILDSGAFRTIELHGGYPDPPEEYATEIVRWKGFGEFLAAVTQDLMCEAFMLAKTGLTVADHQRLTVTRYDALLRCETGVYLMPVLQGFEPDEYVDCIRLYGDRLGPSAWVGVGSICRRNGSPRQIRDVLFAIKEERPDLRLHGFGIKITSLSDPVIRALFFSADSNAWSASERKKGRSPNNWEAALDFRRRILIEPLGQRHLIELLQPERNPQKWNT